MKPCEPKYPFYMAPVCGESEHCKSCGWNPAVAEKRKERIRNREMERNELGLLTLRLRNGV